MLFRSVEDKISKSFQLTDFSTIDTASMLSDYYSRIDKYFSRFPSRSRGIRNNSIIPILWYDEFSWDLSWVIFGCDYKKNRWASGD